MKLGEFSYNKTALRMRFRDWAPVVNSLLLSFLGIYPG